MRCRMAFYNLGTRHCYANCVAFNHLQDYYPEGVKEFKTMIAKHKIDLPQGLSKSWTSDQITAMAKVAYNLPHMWAHAIDFRFEEKVTMESISELYRRL